MNRTGNSAQDESGGARPAIVAKVRLLTDDEADVVPISGIDVLVGRSAADHLDDAEPAGREGEGARTPRSAPRPVAAREVSPPDPRFADHLRQRFTDANDSIKSSELHLDHVETVAEYYSALTARSRRGRRG